MSAPENNREDQRSLIKYAKPVIVSTMGKRGKDKAEGKDIATTDVEDILNSILPPREYTKDKQQLYIESVLSTPATETDVIMLSQDLDKRLLTKQARETGICPKREELYAQCFDELIRQITISCSHRGLLLVRVRDEMRMMIHAYQNLYESALSYGMRKALQGEQRRAEMTATISSLTIEVNALETQVAQLDESIKKVQELDELDQANSKKNHEDEVAKMKGKIKALRDNFESKLSGEEKKKQQEKERKEREKKEKKEKKEKERAAGGGSKPPAAATAK